MVANRKIGSFGFCIRGRVKATKSTKFHDEPMQGNLKLAYDHPPKAQKVEMPIPEACRGIADFILGIKREPIMLHELRFSLDQVLSEETLWRAGFTDWMLEAEKLHTINSFGNMITVVIGKFDGIPGAHYIFDSEGRLLISASEAARPLGQFQKRVSDYVYSSDGSWIGVVVDGNRFTAKDLRGGKSLSGESLSERLDMETGEGVVTVSRRRPEIQVDHTESGEVWVRRTQDDLVLRRDRGEDFFLAPTPLNVHRAMIKRGLQGPLLVDLLAG